MQPAVGVHRAFRLSGGARGVDDEGEGLGGQALGFGLLGLAGDEIVPINVTPFLHGDARFGSLEDDDFLDLGPGFERLIHQGLYAHFLAPAHPAVRREDEPRLGVVESLGDGFRAEARENRDRDDADLKTREHGEDGLRDHGHEDAGAVSGAHPHLAHGVRQAADLRVHLRVGVAAHFSAVSLPDEGRFVTRGRVKMPVDAVVDDVELPAQEPLRPGQAAR